jgi:hypothetical protein
MDDKRNESGDEKAKMMMKKRKRDEIDDEGVKVVMREWK